MADSSRTAIDFGTPGEFLDDDDKQAAHDIKQWLEDNGGTDVTLRDQTGDHGILPLIPIVIGAAIGAAALAKLVTYVWEKFQYEQIVTYHDGEAKVTIVKIRNGKVLVFADKDTVVQIDNPKDPIDLTEVAKAAIGNADAGKAAANKNGKDATVTQPDDDQTKKALGHIADSLGDG